MQLGPYLHTLLSLIGISTAMTTTFRVYEAYSFSMESVQFSTKRIIERLNTEVTG
jgi:hypothetical protein